MFHSVNKPRTDSCDPLAGASSHKPHVSPSIFGSIGSRAISALVLLAASADFDSGRCDSLIINGSFESGMNGWIQSSQYVYPEWKNTWNTAGHGASPPATNAQDGTHSINVHGRAVSQVVDVIPGLSYELKFHVGSYGSSQDVTYWGGLDLVVFQGSLLRENLTPALMGTSPVPGSLNPIFDRFTNFEPGGERIAWKEFTYPFLATGDQVAFVFQGGAYSFSIYTGLDAVSLLQVPEPSSLALVATGILACGLFRWRQQG